MEEKVSPWVIFITLVILMAASTAVFLSVRASNDPKNRLEIVNNSVSKISEFAVAKYNYTNIVEYSDEKKLNEWKLPFTEKRFIIKYSGYVKAGVDVSKIEISETDDGTLNIVCPKAEFFDNVIPEEDVYFFDERDTVFNKLKFDDLYSLLIDEKKKIEIQLKKDGFLSTAENNFKDLLEVYVEPMGFEEINISFK